MASRQIVDLSPLMQDLCKRHLALCSSDPELLARHVAVILTCTYRSPEEQELLYAQGRTAPGPIVTNARGGQSKHNVLFNALPAAEAYDVVPVENGKAAWADSPAWARIGALGKSLGLKWYGDPGSPFKEAPHFQNPHL